MHQGILACVRTTQQILDLISTRLIAEDRGPCIVSQWWHTVTYVYNAATVLIMAHIFPRVVQETTATSLSGSIQRGLQILGYHARYGESARHYMNALDTLCGRHLVNRHGNVSSAGQSQRADNPQAEMTMNVPPALWTRTSDTPPNKADPSTTVDWDFTSASDLYSGEELESLLFSTRTCGARIG